MVRLSWQRMFIAVASMNLFAVLYIWKTLDSRCSCGTSAVNVNHIEMKRRFENKIEKKIPSFFMWKTKSQFIHHNLSTVVESDVTFVLYEFEFFEHNLEETVKHLSEIYPLVPILIVSDLVPYPPLLFLKTMLNSNVQLISLDPGANKSSTMTSLYYFIKTKYVVFVPDASRMTSTVLSELLQFFLFLPNGHLAAARIRGQKSICLSLDVDLKRWTLTYRQNVGTKICDSLQGKHLLIWRTHQLLDLNQPLVQPFPEALFIQTTSRNLKVHISPEHLLSEGRLLFKDAHLREKQRMLDSHKRMNLYKKFGIKKVILPGNQVHWYGCEKQTSRCFGTVHNDMPEYLFLGRWTPPCCLENLRKTARHVFQILEKCEVKYWLEGGSLLGAFRSGDIIPWDYDVDIGVYADDILKCEWLKNAQKQSIVDTSGFVWEKAREGDFLRVQFSQTNHLHVDIFPFYSRNGIMTKNTWFKNHPQDREFPEHFLHPLEKLQFVGIMASVPNNIKGFLELKFGKGAVDNPQYPVPSVLKVL
ncbi:fukutin-related protein-like isoform X2 [Limulus polyphemus]|nr:fukutin-related protein-like isoform X2 [Limulus polyphemus]XP_022239385.1 fukutin-related protein-like isoform X2 [Limulus polyphemus]XP_022239386.1 fukutin-related protein-like isoform X2 [Limulus polyphemus]XP_022239387.1 fukutin-related protein-like isoform X2 [Limulus polyphemus]XP_022239388.1 fukutin-related protein-like isoform X2 [Limulus polyphemus]XP_022239389.1 fukutin-related protein-like isoform X2 [Limulus polyphemus]